MKHCTNCKEKKPLEQFNRHSKRKDGRQSWCRACNRAAMSRHYKENAQHRARIARNNKAATIRAQQYVLEYLQSHPCIDCGEDDPVVLDFDHLRDKTAAISVMVNNQPSITRLKEEILKCEVRCSNCHRRKTAKELGYYRYKALSAV